MPPQIPTTQRALPTPPSLSQIRAQATGQSTHTIDAAYDGVLSQLDALANQTTFPYPTPPSTSSNPSRPSARSLPGPTQVTNIAPSAPATVPMTSPSLHPPICLGIRLTGEGEVSRLEAVSERTEPISAPPSTTGSPTAERAAPEQLELVTQTITTQYTYGPQPVRDRDNQTPIGPSPADRTPMPISTVRGPRQSAAPPQASPKKASELIRLFEARSGGPSQPPAPPPAFPMPQTEESRSRPPSAGERFESIPQGAPSSSIFQAPPPPSSFRQPFSALGPEVSSSPPVKPPSPLSQVRTMIASWRARAGSPSQRVIGSPGRGRSASLFGRDRGWNVSIRRRRRHEGTDEVGLAEQAEEPAALPIQHERSEPTGRNETGPPEEVAEPSRSPSSRSATPSAPPRVARALTGQVST